MLTCTTRYLSAAAEVVNRGFKVFTHLFRDSTIFRPLIFLAGQNLSVKHGTVAAHFFGQALPLARGAPVFFDGLEKL